jgi:hypothetical protein
MNTRTWRSILLAALVPVAAGVATRAYTQMSYPDGSASAEAEWRRPGTTSTFCDSECKSGMACCS